MTVCALNVLVYIPLRVTRWSSLSLNISMSLFIKLLLRCHAGLSCSVYELFMLFMISALMFAAVADNTMFTLNWLLLGIVTYEQFVLCNLIYIFAAGCHRVYHHTPPLL